MPFLVATWESVWRCGIRFVLRIYCKKKNCRFLQQFLVMEMREVESLIPVGTSCASLHAAPFAVARIRAGFSSLWSALTTLRDSLWLRIYAKKRLSLICNSLLDGDEGSRIPYLLHAMQAL